jgi:hypothetical protein
MIHCSSSSSSSVCVCATVYCVDGTKMNMRLSAYTHGKSQDMCGITVKFTDNG